MQSILICSEQSSFNKHLLLAIEGQFSIRTISKEYLASIRDDELSEYSLLIVHLHHADDLNCFKYFNKNKTIPLIVFDSEPTLAMAIYALELGAKGYTNAFASPKNLILAIEVVLSGNIYFPEKYMSQMVGIINSSMKINGEKEIDKESFVQKINSFLSSAFDNKDEDNKLSSLTPREKEVANCITDGMANKEIASKLNISNSTVKAHLQSIYEKLDLHDRLSMALYFKEKSNEF